MQGRQARPCLNSSRGHGLAASGSCRYRPSTRRQAESVLLASIFRMSCSHERQTIRGGSVSCGGEQGGRGRSEPAERRRLEFLHFPRVCANCGAGAFACQPRARPMPGASIFYQAGAYRVVLHIVNDAVQFRFIAHTMVEGFILPEGLPRSAQNQVGLSRGGAFQPARNHRHGGTGPKAALSTSRSKTRKARPADRRAPVGGCGRSARGMEPPNAR